jgi:hypothetical protein
MGWTSITPGRVVAPTSPTEAVPTASTARGGLSTFESATGGEVALLSTAPRGPMTCGLGDLVREGEDRTL